MQGSGVARVIQVPDDVGVLSSEFLQSLALGKEDKRVIFKTRNTSRRLLDKTQFEEDFVALDAGGAEYMVSQSAYCNSDDMTSSPNFFFFPILRLM